MDPLASLIALLVTIYIGCVLTTLGFAVMLGGNRWVSRVMRFWFTAPAQWIFVSLGAGILRLLQAIGSGIADLLRSFGIAMLRVLDGIILAIALPIRWLLTGRRR